MKLLIEGKAKKIYISQDKGFLIQYFKDDTTAYNNKKKKKFLNKGIINNYISADIFNFLKKNRIDNHYIRKLNSREQLIKKVAIIPLEIVIRNYAAGSLIKNLSIQRGKVISPPIVEFYLKSDKLNDPLINEDHILFLKLCSEKEIKKIKTIAKKVNILLLKYFKDIKVILVDFKIEVGKHNNKIILADEISPDCCRLWDKITKKSMDKDLFRENKGNLLEGYNNIYNRIRNKNNDL